ncbi:hypothetical protein JB92DRAFT_2922570 [Gautieria morchelliformis]|nr:hypothetical protein JB92DRAFT_2922570 [Gautieria morchelliformis]
MSAETTNILESLPFSRRIITGHDDNGKSKVLYDDTKGNIEIMPNGTTRFHTVWFTDNVPADCSSVTNGDPTGNKTFRVANDGSVCTIVFMGPGSKAPMHRTKSIDYAVILEGEIELELENGDKSILKTGDVVVQRETMHSWRNPHSTNVTKIFFVVVASKGTESEDFQFGKRSDKK